MAIYELGSEPGTKVIRTNSSNEPLPGCALPQEAAAIEELWDWSINFDGPNPFNIFADLVGYSQHSYGCLAFSYERQSPDEILGYKEISLLVDALKLVKKYGNDQVYDWIDQIDRFYINEPED